MGGCANQIFQYVTGLALARRLGVELKLDMAAAFGCCKFDRQTHLNRSGGEPHCDKEPNQQYMTGN
jgi:hypothetical protein